MKNFSCAVAILALGSASAMAECVAPERPELPNGGSASMEQMLAGQKAVKAFQEANVAYMKCLEEAFTSAEATVKAGGDDAAEAQKAYSEAVEAYNEAVSAEEAVAGQFNTEIREYKAANPG